MSFLERIKRLPYAAIAAFSFAWSLNIDRYIPEGQYLGCYLISIVVLVGLVLLMGAARTVADSPALFAVECLTAFASIFVMELCAPLTPVAAGALYTMVTLFSCHAMIKSVGRIGRLGMADAMLSFAIWQGLSSLLAIANTLPSCAIILATPVVVFLLLGGVRPCPAGQGVKDGTAQDAEASADQGSQSALPWKLLALDVLVVLFIYLLWGSWPASGVAYGHAGSFAAAFAILAFVAASGRLVRAKVLYNTSLGLLQLAVVCLAVGSTWGRTTALCLTDAAYVTFSVFFLTLLSVLCARGGRDFGAALAVALILEDAAALAGSFLAQAATPGQLPALIVGLSATIVLAFTFLASESDYHTSWGMERPRRNRADPMAYYYSLGQICSAIAMQHSLSKREADVLLLLAQKKHAPEIAEELFVSVSTVKTHTNNIYKKLDVHSRKELYELINDLRAPSSGAK